MLSGILKSERAFEVNIAIMRAFVQVRKLLQGNKDLAHKIKELEKLMSDGFAHHDDKYYIAVSMIYTLFMPNSKFVFIGAGGATLHLLKRAEIKERKDGGDPLEVFSTAVRNAGPMMEVRSRRVGGANYQVPREVRPERRLALALRWIINGARNQKGVPMHKALAQELILAAKEEGNAVKKKEDTHKMAEANRAFAHFAW